MHKYLPLLLLCIACRQKIDPPPASVPVSDTGFRMMPLAATGGIAVPDSSLPEKIVAFAMTQRGVPYRYCSMSPDAGFDCSGFVNYVFDHFHIKVPRSSVEFTNEGEEIPLSRAQPGDLILFTGTNAHIRVVGHIGIVAANDNGEISFIHSSSGAAYSVVVSPLDKYYRTRFVKVIRILP